jgi:SAM-dependent methyltransferase
MSDLAGMRAAPTPDPESRDPQSRDPQSRDPQSRDPQSFDHLAAHFDRFAALVGAELQAWLLFRLAARGGRAVDLGCGTGVHTELLADRYTEILAVDLSEPMLTHARTRRPRGNICYEQRNLTEVTPERDGRFDLVFTAYTLHHLPDLGAAFARLRELVRPGGQLIAVDVVDIRPPRTARAGEPAETVDPPGTVCVPRNWFRRQAARAFLTELRHCRRPPRESLELLRLQLDPAWLDHQTTDRLLTAADWETAARRAFPDAQITPFHRARAVHWHAPDMEPRP